MIEFPNVFIHENFSYLLSQNLLPSHHTNQFLIHYFKENRVFHNFIVNSCIDIDPLKRVDFIIKVLGWVEFRNRLASILLQYERDHQFPSEVDMTLCHDLIEFDDKLFTHVVSGSSRAFLFALYLKISSIYDKDSVFKVPLEVLDLLSKIRVKMIKVDWVILILWHFVDAMGFDRVEKKLSQASSFLSFENDLSSDQKEKFYANILTYSYAINDSDFFQKKV